MAEKVWVRDAFKTTEDLADPSAFVTDLLYKARSGDTVTNYETAAAKAALEQPLAPFDVTGALVLRVHLRGVYVMAPFLGALPQDIVPSMGVYLGLRVSEFTGPAHATTSAGPGGVSQSVGTDWMWWERLYLQGPGDPAAGVELAAIVSTDVIIRGFEFDCKSRRVLEEWNDSLGFYIQASSGQTLNGFFAAWSVLLQMP